MKIDLIIKFFAIIGICAIAFVFGRISKRVNPKIEYKEKVVIKVDTHYVDKPVEVIRYKDKLVYVPVTDSVIVHQHDTTYIALQFEKVEYADSTYKAVVSGYQPKLEFISVYPKTAYITNTIVERRHWGASVTAGPAVVWSFNGKVHAGLGAAIGLSYNF